MSQIKQECTIHKTNNNQAEKDLNLARGPQQKTEVLKMFF